MSRFGWRTSYFLLGLSLLAGAAVRSCLAPAPRKAGGGG